jgi:transposase-like protein
MAAAPICMTCNLERTLVSIQPTRNRHDVRQYECHKCRSVFRLVVQRAPLDSDEVAFDASPLQAEAQ